jgi:hypothetical protein
MIKSRKMSSVGYVEQIRVKSNLYRSLVGKPERKRSLGRLMLRWVYHIEMDRGDSGGGGLWTGFIWLRNWNSGELL